MKKTTTYVFQTLFAVLEHSFNIFIDTLLYLISLSTKSDGFSARFGSERDIGSVYNKGFLFSVRHRMTRRRSFENLLLCGPTGSGKTQKILLKNLAVLKNCSIIVNDVSKECFFNLAGYHSEFFNILTLNFSDSRQSAGYNLLSRIKRPNDVNKIAHVLVSATLEKGGGDPFWGLQSRAIIEIFIRLALHQKPMSRNMATVLHILKTFAISKEKIERWIIKTGDQKLLLDFRALAAMPDKTLQNVIASAKGALQIFEDNEIAKVTSHDTIDFDKLREKPTILYLHNSVSSMKYINTLIGIFFEQLYGHILEKLPSKNELDLFIILEEASSLFIPILPVAIANTRKHRVGNLICVQSPGQLQTLYHTEAQNIVANCVTKLYLPGQASIDLLRDIETYGGKTVFTNKRGAERVRPLITVDEIRMLPDNRSLILSGNMPLIIGRTTPIYRSWKYRNKLNLPLPEIQGIPDYEAQNEERSEDESAK